MDDTISIEKLRRLQRQLTKFRTNPFSGWGHLPSPEPEYFLRKFGADLIMIGESDETVKEVLEVLETNRNQSKDWSLVKGIAYLDNFDELKINERRPLIQDIDSIPFPAYDFQNVWEGM